MQNGLQRLPIVSRLGEAGQRTWQRLHTLDDLGGGWPGMLLRAGRDIFSFRFSLTSAAVAYFTLFSIFPLLLLTVAIASGRLDPVPELAETDLHEIVKRFEFVVPAIDELLGDNLERIERNRGAITGFSAVSLLWSASSVFYVLSRSLDQIWARGSTRPAWRHRALALIVTLTMSLVLWTASVAGSAAVAIMLRLIPERLAGISVYFGMLGTAALSILAFALLYFILPHVQMQWRDVVPGAIVAGLMWELAKRAFFVFVTNYLTITNLVYGSVTAIIAFLVWSYASSLIFFYGAHVNVRYHRRRERRGEAVPQM